MTIMTPHDVTIQRNKDIQDNEYQLIVLVRQHDAGAVEALAAPEIDVRVTANRFEHLGYTQYTILAKLDNVVDRRA